MSKTILKLDNLLYEYYTNIFIAKSRLKYI